MKGHVIGKALLALRLPHHWSAEAATDSIGMVIHRKQEPDLAHRLHTLPIAELPHWKSDL